MLSFYLSVAAVGVIIWSYVLNEEYVKFCSELLSQHTSLQHEMFLMNKKAIQVFFCNYVSQTFLAIVFCFSTMNLPMFPPKKFLVGVLFIFPTIINAALPSSVLTITPALVAIITFFVLVCYFINFISKLPKYIWIYFVSLRFSFQLFQITHIISLSWRDYHVSYVLQVFGITRLLKDLVFLVYDDVFTEYLESGSFTLSAAQIQYIFQELLIKSCDNIIAILGVTSVLSVFVDKAIYKPVQKFLIVPQDEEKSISSAFSQVLIILTVQLGITSLKPEPRLLSIVNISMLMGAIILHQIQLQICNILTALSVMGNLSYSRHSRALTVSFSILVICLLWMTFLLKKYSFNPWLVPVILFNIEIVLSLVISFIIYVLNIIHLHSHRVWYELYDYIYYLESTNNVISLVLGVFFFIKGIYTFCESRSILKLIFLVAHFYHNIYKQIINGWKSIKQRQIISDCVSSLLIASEKEIEEVGGLCAICYEDIGCHVTSVTRCNHFFHCYCLKKWLCERRTCPICHRIILHDDESERSYSSFIRS